MSLRDRIPVEPLDSARLDRIEQRVVAAAAPLLARPRRAPWAPWILAGTAALAAAALVLVLGGGRGAPARPSTAMVVATEAERTRVDLGDAVVEVGPGTRLEVTREGGGVAIALAHGDIALEVPPRQGRPPLWVHAGDVGVRVVGTGFRVRREDAVAVDVEVRHGAVEVHRGRARALVATGERWSSLDGHVVAIAAAPRGPGTTVAGGGVGDARRVAATGGPAAAGTIATGDLALGATAAGPELPDRRPARAPAASSSSSPSTPSTPSSPTTGAASGPSTAARAPRGSAPASRSAPPAAVRPPPDLRAEVLAQPVTAPPPLPAGAVAATAEERAASFQTHAARSRGAEAATAQWGHAATLAGLGKDAEALRALDGYVRRFPRGTETEAVLWLRLRLLCRRGLDEPCRAAAHTYLARFPGTARGDLALRVTRTR